MNKPHPEATADAHRKLYTCVRSLLRLAAQTDAHALTDCLRRATLKLASDTQVRVLLSLKAAAERAAVTARHHTIAVLAPKLRKLSFELEYERGLDDVYHPDILSMTLLGDNHEEATVCRLDSDEELLPLQTLTGVQFTETLSPHTFIERLEELCIACYIDCCRDEIAFDRT